MHDILSDEEQRFEEEWKIILSTKGEYTLSKNQAMIIKQAFTQKEKAVVFESFIIPLAYVAECYRVKRFLKDTLALPSTAQEEEYKPVSPERWEELKKNFLINNMDKLTELRQKKKK